MFAEACIDDFLVLVNNDANIDSKNVGVKFLLEGQPPCSPVDLPLEVSYYKWKKS